MSGAALTGIPFLDEATVERHLDLDALIGAMERAFIDFSAGKVVQPVRQLMPVEPHGGFFGVMPAIGEAMGIKLVTFYPGNAAHDLPTHLGLILLFRPETGEAEVMMDGRLITEMRTAAGSAAAAKALAPADSRALAILGSGVQARAHAEMMPRVHDYAEVRLWGRTAENARACAEEIGATWCEGAEDAVRGADVVVCTTAAKEPIFDGAWLKGGAFVSSVGWNTKAGRELDDATMAHPVIVESREAALDQSGNILVTGAEIHAELGEILAGTRPAPAGQTCVFDSIGIAAMDMAAAKLVLDAWRAAGET